MVKRVTVVVILVLLSSTFLGNTVLARKRLALGGGLTGSIPQLVGEYRQGSFSLKAGFGVKESGIVLSAGGQYYIDFQNDLNAEPYLGAGVFLAEDTRSAPPPPPPPSSNSVTTAIQAGEGDRKTIFSLSGGLEISVPSDWLPLSFWAGAVYVPGSENEDRGQIGSGVSVGLKLWL